jgi:hypothetical protein
LRKKTKGKTLLVRFTLIEAEFIRDPIVKVENFPTGFSQCKQKKRSKESKRMSQRAVSGAICSGDEIRAPFSRFATLSPVLFLLSPYHDRPDRPEESRMSRLALGGQEKKRKNYVPRILPCSTSAWIEFRCWIADADRFEDGRDLL